jgi:hypothetical protein
LGVSFTGGGRMKYYLLKTNNFPSEFADGDSVILIQDENNDAEVNVEDLVFMTTLVVNARNDQKALEEFSTWWQQNTEGEYELELLTEEVEHLNEERKEFVGSLSENEWSLKDSFMAYGRNDLESFNYAKEIILESEFRVQ